MLDEEAVSLLRPTTSLSLGAPMSITLLDIYATAGFLRNGIHIKEISPPEPIDVSDYVLAYGKFLDSF